MNGKIAIEKGIPIPNGPLAGIVEIFRKMEIGDSFLWPRVGCNGAHKSAKEAGIKIKTRTADEQHIRIWRVS